MSNLKQIGLGMMQYTQDYNESYPVASFDGAPATGMYWYQVIDPYIKNTQVFICPSAGQILKSDGTVQFSGGYGYNIGGTPPGSAPVDGVRNGFGYRTSGDNWWTPSGAGPLKLSEIDEPSTTIQIADPASSGYANNGLYAVGYSTATYMPVLHGGQVGPFTSPTSAVPLVGGGNYLFADGHVKFLSASQSFGSAKWNVDKSNPAGVKQP